MIEQIETCCKHVLQRNVRFVLNDRKILRRGKLLLFNVNDYYINFTIKTNKNVKKNYEIFYPYNCTHDKLLRRIEFSYKLDDLCTDKELIQAIRDSSKDNNHVFHDSVVYIYYDA
mgnify:CR=1 FL=1